MTGLIEPVGLDEGVGDLSRFQQTKILDGARAGLRLALQIRVTLASQSTELLDDLVIDPLLTPRGDDGGVRGGLPQQGKQQQKRSHDASRLA
ncbi:hypothetical protein D3C85_1366910 [compost metagenome]